MNAVPSGLIPLPSLSLDKMPPHAESQNRRELAGPSACGQGIFHRCRAQAAYKVCGWQGVSATPDGARFSHGATKARRERVRLNGIDEAFGVLLGCRKFPMV